MSALLFRDDAYLQQCDASVLAADERGIVLDRTVFYPTGGGQPGDAGSLRLADGTVITIADAHKGDSADAVLHIAAPGSPLPAVGAKVVAAIDWARRHRLMRMHTCLHLLSAVLPYPVTGGQVSDGKGRLDFDIADVTLDKDAITERLRALIAEDHAVSARWITDAELADSPELVKTMSVRPPSGAGRVRLIAVEGLDLQACGGTHVAHTGEIGTVVVRKIESKGRQNRRVALELA
jgi:misacylated tRNA(Ala) deacylase